MTRPIPTPIFHFTHIDHLPSQVAHGLLCDELAQAGPLAHEVGNTWIKEQRRLVRVKAGRGGTVDQYSPWYFAPRSPMLYTLNRNGLLDPHGGQDAMVYLISTVEHLRGLGLDLVFTDRNAYYGYATHSDQDADLDDLVDWQLMQAYMWNNTAEEPDRMERRMAECLVHGSVPWEGFLAVATKTEARATEARAMVAHATYQGVTAHQPEVLCKPDWYY